MILHLVLTYRWFDEIRAKHNLDRLMKKENEVTK